MDRATQLVLIRRILGFLDAGTTELGESPYLNGVATYTSAAQLERERAVLFRTEPLLVGLSGDARESGAYFVHEEGGVPILVVRTATGGLNAFVALCRHRGAQIASGQGRATSGFACPYHGWTYDHDGCVTFQPCAEGFAGLDASTRRLVPLPVAERHGMIFVRPSVDADVDVDAHLAGAERELAAYDLARYVPFARLEIERAMNWKLVVDTFLEAYHVSTLHAGSLGPNILSTPAAWDAFGRSSRMVAVRRSIARLRDQPESTWNLLDHAVVLYNLFPNTVVIHQIDHVEMVQAYPAADADYARVVFSLYTPEPVEAPEARRHFQANFDLLVGTIQKEDFRIGEGMQRGFHASGPDATVVYGRNEPGLAHFHRAIAAALRG